MSRGRTVASVHNDWLTLVEPVGAFLTIPVLKRAFPNGIPPVDRDVRLDVRQRFAELGTDAASRTGWLQFVLRDLLRLGTRLREGAAVPATLAHAVPERHTSLRPAFAIGEPRTAGPERVRMLGLRWPFRTALDRRPTADEHGRATDWAATPIERAVLLCRAVDVPLALVTDSDRFALVWAPRGAPAGHAIWASALFPEERLLLDSFVALLGAARFFGVAENETLDALLSESGATQDEVTDRLGYQVRQAVELLVGAFSRANRASGLQLLADIPPSEVYNAAVTVMMRLVVLFAAEERRLLPADDPIYAESYSVLTARDQLERDAGRDGVETLEKRGSAWHRLLATFRAVHEGIQHDRLRLPAYGGSLFDRSRYRFLDSPPMPVDDRTMLAVLDALQVLTFRQGGVKEARRLSYRNLDVEQIGHVYEGLLDHGCTRVEAVSVGLLGSKGDEPEMALSDLERQYRRGEEAFAEWVEEHGGPRAGKVKKLLYEEREPDAEHRLLAACDHDKKVYQRVRAFGGLLREDLRGLPMVWLPGALCVTQTSLRRDSGTAYTTKELADEVVRYALEPLVYSPGPAEGADPKDWALKSSADLLRLKVCDPAVGSGAILVAACRYLADRLVEAWQREGSTRPLPRLPEGVEASDWTLVARRVVTDHCLYGVDRNPMALEMAKLSLWLTTMGKERPFTFLDHQVRCGDSLLGITSLDQVRWFHIDPERGKALWGRRPLSDPTRVIDEKVTVALAKARELTAIDVVTLEDVDRKARLHAEAVAALSPLAVLADAVVGAALASAGGEGHVDDLMESLADRVAEAFDGLVPQARRERALAEIRDRAAYWLETGRPDAGLVRHCLHWPLAFPEVFVAEGRGGFDAIVGNPPFLGGQRITGALGTAYRNHLVAHLAGGVRGSADLVAYFFLRAFALLNDAGQFGLLATNTIAQGDTREVGLDQLAAQGATITRAVPSEPWPGTTSLEIAKVWIRKGESRAQPVLSGAPVRAISPMLVVRGRATGKPHRLKANEGKSFQGSIVLGMGFIMTPEEAHALIAKNPSNREVLFPYLNGEDLNSRSDQSPSRWVINFRDWPLERSVRRSWSRATEKERQAWRRSGRVPRDYAEPVASDFPDCLEIVRRKVKPERDRNHRRVRRERWWQFAERAPDLYATIATLTGAIVVPLVSKFAVFAFTPVNRIFSHALGIIASPEFSWFAAVQSSIHESWAREHGSTLETRMRYTPSDCFETFPFPGIESLSSIGRAYEDHRLAVMFESEEGLTRTYNRFHDPAEYAQGISKLRDLRVKLDETVALAYEWIDVDLGHDFHSTKQGIRFTISPAARQEVLDRLLELNHQRYREEVEQGLHELIARKAGRRSARQRAAEGTPPPASLLEV